MTLALTQKVSLVEDVLLQELAEESVLLNLESEEYFGLDNIGTHMLSVLRTSASIQEACDSLAQVYDAKPDKIATDLLELIDKLLKHGLVKVTDT